MKTSFALRWVLIWLAIAVLAGLAVAGAAHLLELLARVAVLESEVDGLAAPP